MNLDDLDIAPIAARAVDPEKVLVHPYRQIGGQLQYDQIEVWKKEGFPAYCPICQRGWKFVWMQVQEDWVCPMFDSACWVFVQLRDLLANIDGGVFWCTAHEGVHAHRIPMSVEDVGWMVRITDHGVEHERPQIEVCREANAQRAARMRSAEGVRASEHKDLASDTSVE